MQKILEKYEKYKEDNKYFIISYNIDLEKYYMNKINLSKHYWNIHNSKMYNPDFIYDPSLKICGDKTLLTLFLREIFNLTIKNIYFIIDNAFTIDTYLSNDTQKIKSLSITKDGIILGSTISNNNSFKANFENEILNDKEQRKELIMDRLKDISKNEEYSELLEVKAYLEDKINKSNNTKESNELKRDLNYIKTMIRKQENLENKFKIIENKNGNFFEQRKKLFIHEKSDMMDDERYLQIVEKMLIDQE